MKKSSVWLAGILLSAVLVASCGEETTGFIKNTFGEYISAMELKYMIDYNEPYRLIDLRPASSYESGHIATAKNISYLKPSNLMYMINQPYLLILYSNEDIIQKNIYMSLRKSGATNVVMLAGGIYSWSYGLATD
ncbi:MAG: rhodanese-like domain-containing protein [Brevinematales bacterium]|nr:rhodanese-like domain-containing protein [Brevinematales bacterium]